VARPRTERRQRERALEKELARRVRAFEQEPGGSPSRPIDVAAANIVEQRAGSVCCPRCGLRMQIEEHKATVIDGSRLREVCLSCGPCRYRAARYYRVTSMVS
jgi:hypothetical protein